jgi:hypothetical protein
MLSHNASTWSMEYDLYVRCRLVFQENYIPTRNSDELSTMTSLKPNRNWLEIKFDTFVK